MFVVKQLENNSYGELELTCETAFNGFDAAYHFMRHSANEMEGKLRNGDQIGLKDVLGIMVHGSGKQVNIVMYYRDKEIGDDHELAPLDDMAKFYAVNKAKEEKFERY